MVFGRRGTYAAFAVLVALLIAVTTLLAAPAWSDTQNKDSGYPKEATTRKGSSQVQSKPSGSKLSGKETTQRGTSQAKSKASPKDPGRPGVTTLEKDTSQTKSKTSEKPPAGNKVEVRDNDPKGEVNAGDILTVPGDYEGISSDGSVTVKDGEGDQATFDKRNAKLTVTDNGNLRVEVKKDPNFRDGRKLSVKDLKAIKLAGVQHHRHRHHGGSKNSVNNSNDASGNPITTNDATDGDNTTTDNGTTDNTTTDNTTTDNTTTDNTGDNGTTDNTTDNNTTDNGTTNNNGIGNSTGPGCAIASAGGTTAIAGCGANNTTAGDQYNSDTGTNTNAGDQYNSNTGTNSNTNNQNDGNSGTDTTSTDTQNDGSIGTDTTVDPLSDGGGTLNSLDNQDPIDEPPGDVIDEINTGSDLLPETGGLPDIREPRDTGELPETRGVPVAALTPPLGVAFMVMVLAVWRFGARRG